MRVEPVRTERVTAGSTTIEALLDRHVDQLGERSIVAVASKIVSLCEARVASAQIPKVDLVRRESERFIDPAGPHGFRFTITHGTLIPSAGIDESNVGGDYLLWPRDPQASANQIRQHLSRTHQVTNLGVVLTDSTCTPLRRGTSGICLAHSGFEATNSYIGEPDLFGRRFTVSEANIAGGLAATAVLAMGEGAEQTPLCIITDLPVVTFHGRDPSPTELDRIRIDPADDLFSPFLDAIDWKRGEQRPQA